MTLCNKARRRDTDRRAPCIKLGCYLWFQRNSPHCQNAKPRCLAAAPVAPKIAVCLQHHYLLMPKAAAKTAAPPVSYEAALQELEALIAQIESGQLPLEQMLGGYQRAAELLAFCRSKLEAVQEQVKVLDEGQLAPWTQD